MLLDTPFTLVIGKQHVYLRVCVCSTIIELYVRMTNIWNKLREESMVLLRVMREYWAIFLRAENSGNELGTDNIGATIKKSVKQTEQDVDVLCIDVNLVCDCQDIEI